MLDDLKRGLLYTIWAMALFGLAYPLLIWGIGRVAFPAQAEGSLIRSPDGTIVGSRLIAQAFQEARYFHPRPSSCDYNAASSGGSNLGPNNPDHLKAVSDSVAAIVSSEHVLASSVPAEMVTSSGGGLDPHIPPRAAELQVARVARARGLSREAVRELVRAHTERPALGVFGGARVNVLELNLALDERFGKVTK